MPARKDRIRVAAKLNVDPRTIDKYFLTPEKLALPYRVAIRQTLAEMGVPDPHASAQPAQAGA